jgi:hypothetical protein
MARKEARVVRKGQDLGADGIHQLSEVSTGEVCPPNRPCKYDISDECEAKVS